MCPGGAASNRTARRSARPTVRWTVGQSAGRPPPSPPAAGCRSQDAHFKSGVRVFFAREYMCENIKTSPLRCLPASAGSVCALGRGPSNRTARRSARPTVRWTVGQSAGRPPPSPPAAGCRSQDAHLKREVRVFLPANIGMQKYKNFSVPLSPQRDGVGLCPGGAASNRTARRSARPTVRWTVGQSAGRPPPSHQRQAAAPKTAHFKREVRVFFLPANTCVKI